MDGRFLGRVGSGCRIFLGVGGGWLWIVVGIFFEREVFLGENGLCRIFMVVGDWLQVMLAYFVWFADGKGW